MGGGKKKKKKPSETETMHCTVTDGRLIARTDVQGHEDGEVGRPLINYGKCTARGGEEKESAGSPGSGIAADAGCPFSPPCACKTGGTKRTFSRRPRRP